MAAASRAVEAPKTGSPKSQKPVTPPVVGSIGALVLLRLAVGGGATRADISRDLKGLGGVGATPAAFRALVEAEAAALAKAGFLGRATGRMDLSAEGLRAAGAVLGIAAPGAGATFAGARDWGALRDGPLTLKALGADPADAKLAKAAANHDALRALVVQAAFGLPVDRPMSLGKLRTMLALRALERAFGNQIKAALGSGGGLAPKPSRLLAGQLLRSPKEYGTDGRLIAALAAEHLATATGEPEALRAALIRRWVSGLERAGDLPLVAKQLHPAAPVAAPIAISERGPAAIAPRPANDRGLAAEVAPVVAPRPDLPGFVGAVKRAADKRAEGWPGNRKAFICHVWDEIRAAHPQWALSEIEFKGMLAEAHRTGGLILANADLKDKRFIQEFEKSAIQYKNTVWHFVRVAEP